MASSLSSVDKIISHTEIWISSFIVGLDICPFARGVLDHILYTVHQEEDPITIINQLMETITSLRADATYVTSFLILPEVTMSFDKFYALSQICQEEVDRRWGNEFILVAFHPLFYYEGSKDDDTANAVNRSPYPMIHILTSQSMGEATQDVMTGERIAGANKKKLDHFTWEELHKKYRVPINQTSR